MTERTYVMIKPDGYKNKLVGEVISRFEKKGFNLVSLKLIHASKEVAEEHYAEHKEKKILWRINFIHYIRTCCCYGLGRKRSY